MERRTFVRGVGVLTVTGALAGCSGDGSDSNGGDETTAGGNGSGDAEMVSAPSEVSSYLDNDDVFNDEQGGQMADMTGEDSVQVSVGTEANNGTNGFSPSAMQIDSGTTVTWAWQGGSVQHNVVDEDGAFESDLKASGTFEQTFDEAGTYLYYCNPHKTMGMKGAIVVE